MYIESGRSAVEDPVKKCALFLTYFDGSCEMPTYIL